MHASVAETVFYGPAFEVRENLNLDKMIDVSNDSDQEFKDTAAHNYPNSYKRTIKYLEEGKASYNENIMTMPAITSVFSLTSR